MSLFWIIPVVLCGFGIALIVYGIRYNKEDYEYTSTTGRTIVAAVFRIRSLERWLSSSSLLLLTGLSVFSRNGS